MLLLMMLAGIWLFAPLDARLMRTLWFLPGLGVLGSGIASTSGTGGGVVFVPVFHALRLQGVLELAPHQVTAISFLIQCFGMSMGALRWGTRLYEEQALAGHRGARVDPHDFWRVVASVLVLSVPVMLVTQRLAHFEAGHVLVAFKSFSILLGFALILSAWAVNRTRPERCRLERSDLIVLALLAVPGGFVTALFSIGIGELVALYLFIRNYPILLSTGAVTVISCASVLSGALWHIGANDVPWSLLALVAPGALVGGYVGRPVALWLGPLRLKTANGLWIMLSSIYLIWISV